MKMIGKKLNVVSRKKLAIQSNDSFAKQSHHNFQIRTGISSFKEILMFFFVSSSLPSTDYYCPIENFADLFEIFLGQNQIQPLTKSLTVCSNLHNAHDATALNIELNQFCLLRLKLYQTNLSRQTSLELTDPSIISFDRLRIGAYDDQ